MYKSLIEEKIRELKTMQKAEVRNELCWLDKSRQQRL